MSITLINALGTDLTVVNAARVSFAKERAVLDTQDAKLIEYLASHGHESPFFHCVLTFRIKMPIAIARQWFKSTVGFARNEVSRRYVSDTPQIYKVPQFRLKSDTKKQGSSDQGHQESAKFIEKYNSVTAQAVALYDEMVTAGVCPEQARFVLPQATYTEFIETGSLAAYARLFKLRTSPDAQQEIRMYARLIGDACLHKFPHSWVALTNTKCLNPQQKTLPTGAS